MYWVQKVGKSKIVDLEETLSYNIRNCIALSKKNFKSIRLLATDGLLTVKIVMIGFIFLRLLTCGNFINLGIPENSDLKAYIVSKLLEILVLSRQRNLARNWSS